MSTIRQAAPEDLVDVMRLFDGALLETNADRVSDQLTASSGCLLLATDSSRPVGAIGIVPAAETNEQLPWSESVYISAIAVTNSCRGQGLGRSLIEAAADWAAPRPLSATFDERVRPFYLACGFDVETRAGRLWGLRRSDGVD